MKVLSNGLLILFIMLGLSVPSFGMSVNRDTAYTSTAKGLSKYYQPRAVLVDRNRMPQRNNYIFTPQQARYYGYRGGGYGTYGGYGGYRGRYGGYRGGYGSPYRYR